MCRRTLDEHAITERAQVEEREPRGAEVVTNAAPASSTLCVKAHAMVIPPVKMLPSNTLEVMTWFVETPADRATLP